MTVDIELLPFLHCVPFACAHLQELEEVLRLHPLLPLSFSTEAWHIGIFSEPLQGCCFSAKYLFFLAILYVGGSVLWCENACPFFELNLVIQTFLKNLVTPLPFQLRE